MFGYEICHKMDINKPIVKAVKIMQTMLCDPDKYVLEKLQRLLKTNKAEFLRILLMFNEVCISYFFNHTNKTAFVFHFQEKTKKICDMYKQKYNINLEDEIKSIFKEDVTKLLLKRLHHKNEMK